MTGVKGALLALLLLVAAAACLRTQAKVLPEPPPLDVPPAPPRVVQPMPAEEVGVAEAPDAGVAERTPAKRPATRSDLPKVEPPKTDAAKHDPGKPETPPDPTAKPPAPPEVTRAATLEPPLPAGGPHEVERTIQRQMKKAQEDLGKVNYKNLSADGRSQYDGAKRFIDQAEQALKERNFVYASKLADKAATLAALLLGR